VRPQGVYRGTHPPASRYGPLGLLNVKGERVSYNGRWYKFVEEARLEAARRRIEESDLPLETLAHDLGFGGGENLRRAFQRRYSVNPDYFRDTFGRSNV
jgi:AraC-like DNA-binding protein